LLIVNVWEGRETTPCGDIWGFDHADDSTAYDNREFAHCCVFVNAQKGRETTVRGDILVFDHVDDSADDNNRRLHITGIFCYKTTGFS
jgi:hypothetical protein